MNKVINFLTNEQNLAIIAMVLIVISIIVTANLYAGSSYDNQGNSLSLWDTIKNIFGLLPAAVELTGDAIGEVVDTTADIVDSTVEVIRETTPIVEDRIKDTVRKVTRKKEVFNVDSNDYTYDEAPYVCKALGAKLATYDQVLDAHKKGGHWCNYGWSGNQMALYPTQEKVWKNLQKGSERDSCGKPGVNGGYFENRQLKFGVNCYGYKPKPDPAKIVYHNDGAKIQSTEQQEEKMIEDEMLNRFKQMAKDGKLEVRPFSGKKWSNYSYKNSSYIINPSYSISRDSSTAETVEAEIDDDQKNPNNYNQSEEEINVELAESVETSQNDDVL